MLAFVRMSPDGDMVSLVMLSVRETSDQISAKQQSIPIFRCAQDDRNNRLITFVRMSPCGDMVSLVMLSVKRSI